MRGSWLNFDLLWRINWGFRCWRPSRDTGGGCGGGGGGIGLYAKGDEKNNEAPRIVQSCVRGKQGTLSKDVRVPYSAYQTQNLEPRISQRRGYAFLKKLPLTTATAA